MEPVRSGAAACPTSSASGCSPTPQWLRVRWCFGGVLEELPRLRVCLAHGCGTFPWALPRMARGMSMAPGARSTDHLEGLVRHLWADSLVFDPAHLPLLFERFGADHVVLGSDFPFYPADWGPPTAVLQGGLEVGACTAGADCRGVVGERRAFPRGAAVRVRSAGADAGGVKEGPMGDLLLMGMTHYPPLAAVDADMAGLMRGMLQDPGIPTEAKDPGSWSPEMRAEWGDRRGAVVGCRPPRRAPSRVRRAAG